MSMFGGYGSSEDEDLNNFEPDFSFHKEDLCNKGGGHEYVEIENDGKIQVLKCTKCKHLSVGYF